VELVKQSDLRWDVPTGILCMVFGAMAIYSLLFSIGNLLYGDYGQMAIMITITVVSGILLLRFWKKLKSK
jgi:hypothetical protein